MNRHASDELESARYAGRADEYGPVPLIVATSRGRWTQADGANLRHTVAWEGQPFAFALDNERILVEGAAAAAGVHRTHSNPGMRHLLAEHFITNLG